MSEYIKTIEINGIKMDIDMRYATETVRYKIGDNVKVLRKTYGDSFESFPGVIVGFDPFVNLPTIIVAFLKQSYSDATIEFGHINEKSKDIEICPAKDEIIPFEKGRVVELLDRAINEAEKKVFDLQTKKHYFLNNFSRYFEPK